MSDRRTRIQRRYERALWRAWALDQLGYFALLLLPPVLVVALVWVVAYLAVQGGAGGCQ